MMKILKWITKQRGSRRGSSYIEYFIAAASMAGATVAVFSVMGDGGTGLNATQDSMDTMLNSIAGPVSEETDTF